MQPGGGAQRLAPQSQQPGRSARRLCRECGREGLQCGAETWIPASTGQRQVAAHPPPGRAMHKLCRLLRGASGMAPVPGGKWAGQPTLYRSVPCIPYPGRQPGRRAGGQTRGRPPPPPPALQAAPHCAARYAAPAARCSAGVAQFVCSAFGGETEWKASLRDAGDLSYKRAQALRLGRMQPRTVGAA